MLERAINDSVEELLLSLQTAAACMEVRIGDVQRGGDGHARLIY